MKKFFSFVAILSVLLMASCKKSDNSSSPFSYNIYVSTFKLCDSMLGLSEQDAFSKLESNGWEMVEYDEEHYRYFSNQTDDVLLGLYLNFGEGGKVCGCHIKMTATNLKTDLQNFDKFKELFDLVGYAYKLSSGTACTFSECEYESETGYTRDYKELTSIIQDAFNSEFFDCVWMYGDEDATIVIGKYEDCIYSCSVYDLKFE